MTYRTIISAKSGIVVDLSTGTLTGRNVILTLSAMTIQVTAAMVGQELYSALLDYWKANSSMAQYDFPMYAIDQTSGKYQMGFDGTLYNGWTFDSATTKKNLASMGWTQFNTNGTIAEEWFGISTPPGALLSTDQPYYQLTSGSTLAPTNFTFTGPVNEAVQVFGDATHGNINTTSFCEIYARSQGMTYSTATLAAVSRSASGPYAQAFPLSDSTDINITLADTAFTAAPYTSLVTTFYATAIAETIGGVSHNFNIVVDNTTAAVSLADLYQYLQYLSRQATNINQGASPNNAVFIGKVTPVLANMVGSTLVTTTGVYINAVNPSDLNNITYTDVNGATANNPFTASGTFNFNSVLSGVTSGTFTLYFDAGFGTSTAVIVNDASGTPITGSIAGVSSHSFTFAYDTNTQGGRTAGTNALCDLVVIAPGGAKYIRQQLTLLRQAGQQFAVTGTADSVYTSV